MRQINTFYKLRSKLAIVVACLVIIFANSSIANDSEKEKQLEQLKQTILKLKKELNATKSSRDEVSKSLENTEKNINDLSKKAKSIEKKLQDRREKLDNLRDERSQLNQEKGQQEGIVGDYVNAAYRLGDRGNLRLLLNQEDPTKVSRNLKYYDYLMTARTEKIARYIKTIERINKIEPEISRQTQLIESDLSLLEKQKQALEIAQSQRKQMLAKLNSRISNQGQQLNNLLEDRRQLEKLLSKVIENIADIKQRKGSEVFSSLKGKLPWPTKGKVLRRFGSNRIANKMRWEGLLISSKEGDPVRSVHYGRVVFSDYLRGHGLLIIVDHGAGFMSLYAHNRALFKELGEWVEGGDVIASVGNSGGQKDTALYFELRYKGKPTNPQRWLRRA
ncbi:murein hydrolase activator EnvC family protein [Agarilytica rhodophyticola]|uniref:murein hydrolase activator EnvC family protein n=1 Tax=Agarilytica rhodophyticola TaxID=1737490 RepID=UPI000B3498DA|nr:peptidoglycan DD-metalloendopeptidase family protein [Agarilytica rhodophyticola]